jgi:hypothetical protein
MTKTLPEIESELLQLEAPVRAALARALLHSLEGLSDNEYDELWSEEAEERCKAFRRGELPADDGDEVLAHARNRTL